MFEPKILITIKIRWRLLECSDLSNVIRNQLIESYHITLAADAADHIKHGTGDIGLINVIDKESNIIKIILNRSETFLGKFSDIFLLSNSYRDLVWQHGCSDDDNDNIQFYSTIKNVNVGLYPPPNTVGTIEGLIRNVFGSNDQANYTQL